MPPHFVDTGNGQLVPAPTRKATRTLISSSMELHLPQPCPRAREFIPGIRMWPLSVEDQTFLICRKPAQCYPESPPPITVRNDRILGGHCSWMLDPMVPDPAEVCSSRIPKLFIFASPFSPSPPPTSCSAVRPLIRACYSADGGVGWHARRTPNSVSGGRYACRGGTGFGEQRKIDGTQNP